jgi:hypothetical protein
MTQCTAKSKRTGERCKRHATPGRTVCHYHGGATPRGFALPQTKHGRYSNALPVRLAATYEAARQDPDLLALTDKLAVIEARLLQLMEQLEAGGGARAMARIDDAFKALRGAWENQDSTHTAADWDALASAIAAGKQDAALWQEIFTALEQFRRLSESERKRLIEAERMYDVRSVMTFVGAVAAVLKQVIHDRQVLSEVQMGLDRLLATQYTVKP